MQLGKILGYRKAGILLVLAGVAASCASTPPPKPLSVKEQVRYDNEVGLKLAWQFEKEVTFRQDKEVEVFLRQLGNRLSAPYEELRDAQLGVFVLRDRSDAWRNYSLPGNRIYLSAGLLHNLTFESEIASAIAFELAHLLKRTMLIRLQQSIDPAAAAPLQPGEAQLLQPYEAGSRGPERSVQFFGPGSIFMVPQEAQLMAVSDAIDILYKAGYDSRGLISIWDIYEAHPERSPFSSEMLKRMRDRTYEAISTSSPLRNPIVRSKKFLTLQNRIHNL